jgi:hypothetical protein
MGELEHSGPITVGLAAVGVMVAACGLGRGLSMTAWAAAEAAEFTLPSDAVCNFKPSDNDFGPPDRCKDGSSPHSRTVYLTSLTTSSTVILTGAGYTVFEPEHHAPRDPWCPSILTPST